MSIQLALKKKKYNFKHRLKKIKNYGLKALLSKDQPILDKKQETLYPVQLPTSIDQIMVPVKRNKLGDLLAYEEDQYGRSPWEFLEDSMLKYAEEFHAITWAENGVLLACAWVCSDKRWTKLFGVPFPGKPHPVITDIFYHPQIKDRLGDFISATIIKVLSQKKDPKIYICSHPKKTGIQEWVRQHKQG
ncbi:hypothetical protein QWY93_17740 [Echinicola jeungdonensis]|nr:hypothetical protein [Echinicola jeungdonensis]MDN3671159.1 hypothetical protein [Echinicola jeungdonensis]